MAAKASKKKATAKKAPTKSAPKPASKPAAKPAAKKAPQAAKPAAKLAVKPAAKPAAAAAAPAKPAAPAPAAASSAGTAGVKPTRIGRITEAPPPPPPKRRGILPPLFGPPPTPPKRSKGAPPPVIAKPKPKKKPGTESNDKTPKKKIDYANAVSVAAAAVQAASAPAAPSKKGAQHPGLVMISGRRVRTLSLKGIKVSKPKRAPKAAAAPVAPTEPVALTKTKLSAAELEQYRQVLLRMRRELAGRVHDLEEEALKSSGGNLSNMPLHMADVGTDTFDQDFNIGMAQTERGLVQEIDEALKRIANKTFGMCLVTGKPIPKGRLSAMPWAKYTVDAARQVEKSRPRGA